MCCINFSDLAIRGDEWNFYSTFLCDPVQDLTSLYRLFEYKWG